MNLEDHLPPQLRGPDTTITKVAVGLSGAGVYRVDAGGRAFALKVAREDEPADEWRRRLATLRHAADAGLAPRIVHADEGRHAVLSEFVVDRSFPRHYRDPATHDAALGLLGRTLRRVHELPPVPGLEAREARDVIGQVWRTLAGYPLPPFVGDLIQRLLAERPPADGRAPVLSHNDVNPSNMAFDGERLLLLDWDVAAPNHPYFDLATASVFLRMSAAECRALLAAHDEGPAERLPESFLYQRRAMGTMACAVMLMLMRQAGHPGDTSPASLDAVPPLADFYRRMMAGEVSLATPEGKWWFGLALLKEAWTPPE